MNSIELTERELKIYTWGNARRDRKPADSQKNFSACVISDKKPYGINLKKMTGRHRDVQDAFMKQAKFKTAIEGFVATIRKDPNLTVISINCVKGRHRSVAAAELVKKLLEADGTFSVDLYHLEI